MIFERAAEFVETEKREILMDGEQAGWRCGQTKLFMKDQARYAIESALNRLLAQRATKIQTRQRIIVAKKTAEQRFAARATIQRFILSYIQRKRWRDSITAFARQFKATVVQLQRAFRRRRFRRQVMDWVRKRRNQAMLIQRVWRRIKRRESTFAYLVKRQVARVKLQKAFRWRYMHAAMLREIWRRVKAKKELEEKVRLQAVAEAAVVVELKQQNEQ